MSGSTWTVFSPGAKAKATEVNANFDWIEQTFLPFNAGTSTDNTYDLGSSTFRWRDLYLSRKILVADGTVSLPSYTFGLDTDTGFYRIGANNVGMAVAGTKVMDVNSAGSFLWPLQPAFLATQVNSVAMTNGMNSFVMTSTSEKYDIGGNYNASTGEFVAPRAGIYEFTYGILMTINTSTSLVSLAGYLNYRPAGAASVTGGLNWQVGEHCLNVNGSRVLRAAKTVMIQMAVGDRVYCTYSASGNSSTAQATFGGEIDPTGILSGTVANEHTTYFMGRLVG